MRACLICERVAVAKTLLESRAAVVRMHSGIPAPRRLLRRDVFGTDYERDWLERRLDIFRELVDEQRQPAVAAATPFNQRARSDRFGAGFCPVVHDQHSVTRNDDVTLQPEHLFEAAPVRGCSQLFLLAREDAA